MLLLRSLTEQFFPQTPSRQNNYHLSVSFSNFTNDFYLDLKDIELAEAILELPFERVEEIRIRRDKPTSKPVMIVKIGAMLRMMRRMD